MRARLDAVAAHGRVGRPSSATSYSRPPTAMSSAISASSASPERAVVEARCAISTTVEPPPQQPRYVIEDVVSRDSVDGVRRTVGAHMAPHRYSFTPLRQDKSPGVTRSKSGGAWGFSGGVASPRAVAVLLKSQSPPPTRLSDISHTLPPPPRRSGRTSSSPDAWAISLTPAPTGYPAGDGRASDLRAVRLRLRPRDAARRGRDGT